MTWNEHLINAELLTIRCRVSQLHSDARANITEQGAVELRDMAEDFINKIDSYGEKHVPNWQPQDLGII